MEALKLNRWTSLHVIREFEVPGSLRWYEEFVTGSVRQNHLKNLCADFLNTLHHDQTVVFNGSEEYLSRKDEEYVASLLFDDHDDQRLFNYVNMRSADTAKESIQSALRILKVDTPGTIIFIIRHKYEHTNAGCG